MQTRFFPLSAIVVAGLAITAWFQSGSAQTAAAPQTSQQSLEDSLLASLRTATIASLSDAVDQVVGQRGYMSHDMRPRVPGRIAGRAVTALLRPAAAEKATPQLSTRHSVGIIDNSKPGDVAVIVIENGLDVAGLGGLMATSAKVRGMAGVVIDGGIRDVAEVRALNLPSYARSVVPSSTVGRWAGVDSNIPVKCAGITVNPGDYIVADEDGVVVVPKARAAEVLKRSREIDELETKMVPLIKEHKALSKAVQIFNRI
jgi:regulator of RNase E activity RraA